MATTADENTESGGGARPLSLSWLASVRDFLEVLGAVLVVAVVAYGLGYCSRPGPIVLPARVDTLRVAVAGAETVYVRDTLRLTRLVQRYDTARVRDTVWRDSVVYVRRDAADSAVAACTAVLRDCDVLRARYAALDSAYTAALARSLPACPAHPIVLYAGYGLGVASDGRVRREGQVGVGLALWRGP